MNNQGFFGALWQYWNIHEKPRLDRKNTVFENARVSNREALYFGLWFIIIGLILISISSVLYALFWSMI